MERCHIFAWFSLMVYCFMAFLLFNYSLTGFAALPDLIIISSFLIPYIVAVFETLVSPCGQNKHCVTFNWVYVLSYLVMFMIIVTVVEMYNLNILDVVYMMLLVLPHLLARLEAGASRECVVRGGTRD